jgi:hypothetical protein
VSLRPLVSVSGLTFGDYLLWNWSLNGNHDVIALISGLTLPPLAVILLWLIALNITLLIARSRSVVRSARNARQRSRPQPPSARTGEEGEAAAAGTKGGNSSRKLAA